MFTPKEIASMAVAAAEDKKARDILVLEVGPISSICDYFIICSGLSSTQIKAISENIDHELKERGVNKLRIEGLKDSHWVLLDFGSVVVHVFQEKEREFYDLERLWADAKVVQF